MKKMWPSELIFKFTCDNELIANLLVYVVLLSKLKNNYTIGPLITNMNGEIRITQDVMLEVIKSTRADYPMDYSSPLYDCSGIEIIVETMNDINTRIERGREFYPDKANELQELVEKCENWKYDGKRVVYKFPIMMESTEVNMSKKLGSVPSS